MEKKTKIYTIKKYFKFCQEVSILGGLLKGYGKEHFSFGKNRFHNLIEFCRDNIVYVDEIKESDFLVLPFKFKGINCDIYKKMVKLAKENNKKLICFVVEDNYIPYNIDENVILYKPDIIRSMKLENERSFPMIRHDFFQGDILKNPELSVGFVGVFFNNRDKYLNYLSNSDIKTDFIERDGWWGGSSRRNLKKVQDDYYDNLKRNLFHLCHRGGGNYSYRFYEILMMGRIPIFINTECVLPFEDKINLEDISILVNEGDLTEDKKFHHTGSCKDLSLKYEKNLDYLDKLVPIIKEYYNNNKDRLEEIQKNNRKIWEEYYSSVGFVKNLLKVLHN